MYKKYVYKINLILILEPNINKPDDYTITIDRFLKTYSRSRDLKTINHKPNFKV